MPDTKLTDLEVVTQPDNGDVLYIVDIDQDASKQITYNNLVGTRFDGLSTSFDGLSSELTILVEDNTDNITTLQNDLIDTNINVNTLSSQVQDLSAFITETGETSTIGFGTINVPSDLTIANNTGINTYYNIPQLSTGDTFDVQPVTLGGLSGIFTNSYSLSDNGDGTGAAVIFFYNVTGASVNIPTTIDFKYVAERILF